MDTSFLQEIGSYAFLGTLIFIGYELTHKVIKTVKLPKSTKTPRLKARKELLPLRFGTFVDNGSPAVVDLTKAVHVLTGGTTNSGKGVSTTNLILSLFEESRETIDMSIIDIKRTDYIAFANNLKSVRPIIFTLDKAIERLTALRALVDERAEIFVNAGVKNIQEFNKGKSKLNRLTYHVLIIDELAELVLTFVGDDERKERKKIVNLIVKLTQVARSSGIHVMIATQNPITDVINSLIKGNCSTRFGLRVDSHYNSLVIGVTGADKIKEENGYGILSAPTVCTNRKVKVPFVDKKELTKRLAVLKAKNI
jgi:S-DNA-T family DNA segregation ATPase FtsK/SpoIIIE